MTANPRDWLVLAVFFRQKLPVPLIRAAKGTVSFLNDRKQTVPDAKELGTSLKEIQKNRFP
jgi:hypothetical protein